MESAWVGAAPRDACRATASYWQAAASQPLSTSGGTAGLGFIARKLWITFLFRHLMNAPSSHPKGAGLLQGTAGFLAYADEETSSPGEGPPHKLVVGQSLDCLVTSCADKRLVHVTADPSRVAAALSPDWGDASIGENV